MPPEIRGNVLFCNINCVKDDISFYIGASFVSYFRKNILNLIFGVDIRCSNLCKLRKCKNYESSWIVYK